MKSALVKHQRALYAIMSANAPDFNQVMNIPLKMMNFVLDTMNFKLKMMNCTLKMTDFNQSRWGIDRYRCENDEFCIEKRGILY